MSVSRLRAAPPPKGRSKTSTAAKSPGASKPARVPKKSIAEKMATEIAQLIEKRIYQPGDRLREQEIAARFAVSRGPVREALRILEARSLVHIESMRGATVARLSDEEARDAVEISAVLFGLAARKAAGKTSKGGVAELRALHARLVRMTGDEFSAKQFYQHTVSLGSAVVRMSASRRLQRALADVRAGAPDLYGPLGFITVELRAAAIRKWGDLIDAVDASDGAAADRLAQEIHDDVMRVAVKITG